jgi:monofunctional biosynthetic peptidoglycan transglycosylase
MFEPHRPYAPRRNPAVRIVRAAIVVLLILVVAPYILTPLYAFVQPVSTLMLWRWVTGARVERDYQPLDRISPALGLAVIVAEDGRFCSHHGIDLTEIQNALADAEDFDDLRGGSTITQQVAKNLFLWPGRSYVRKALEVPLALWIDLMLTKRRVLEIYLNIAEWGPTGEFGAEAAARRAFGTPARQLSSYQAAVLAASLPNPVSRNAKAPAPGLRRLAGVYVARAARAPEAANCVR